MGDKRIGRTTEQQGCREPDQQTCAVREHPAQRAVSLRIDQGDQSRRHDRDEEDNRDDEEIEGQQTEGHAVLPEQIEILFVNDRIMESVFDKRSFIGRAGDFFQVGLVLCKKAILRLFKI